MRKAQEVKIVTEQVENKFAWRYFIVAALVAIVSIVFTSMATDAMTSAKADSQRSTSQIRYWQDRFNEERRFSDSLQLIIINMRLKPGEKPHTKLPPPVMVIDGVFN